MAILAIMAILTIRGIMAIPSTGFVLAGGKSSRMGTNKALLELEGLTLAARTHDLLAEVCPRVVILGAPAIYGHLGECFPDVYSGCGPLAGIHVALLNSQTRLNLVTAVDTPFLSVAFLAFLLEQAAGSAAAVTAPEIAGFVQPLCAVYTPTFLPVAEAALQDGRYKITPLFSEVESQVLSAQQLGRFAPDTGMFDNLNTPEDYAKARKRFSGGE
ncbi:MAG TPA: molybdenum cofactor guanylyltransferase [Candidatus Saccharimonadales bacterium]|nr:molybdenum cofactor guanylyltransferase [Candidatus Saccharimonadales bacterium]